MWPLNWLFDGPQKQKKEKLGFTLGASCLRHRPCIPVLISHFKAGLAECSVWMLVCYALYLPSSPLPLNISLFMRVCLKNPQLFVFFAQCCSFRMCQWFKIKRKKTWMRLILLHFLAQHVFRQTCYNKDTHMCQGNAQRRSASQNLPTASRAGAAQIIHRVPRDRDRAPELTTSI